MMTSSPGATSRSNSAPTRSSAQVSEARTQSPSSAAEASGRKPCGSRKAISLPSESATTEKAPSSLAIAFATASSSGAWSFAISAAITSVSEVGAGVTPLCGELRAQLARVDEVAVVPERDRARRARGWTSGWAFAQCVEPVVE